MSRLSFARASFVVMFVAMVLPGGHFPFNDLLVWNAAAPALARQFAEFGFGPVEPTSMFGGL
jgi:hypothetical protein